ncbi:MAG: hypothetical protein J6B71_07840, partial [Clostridia bacterium]|nr:hypothetical protein [Clostridia bacterium]
LPQKKGKSAIKLNCPDGRLYNVCIPLRCPALSVSQANADFVRLYYTILFTACQQQMQKKDDKKNKINKASLGKHEIKQIK